MSEKPQPNELWAEAQRIHPDDEHDAREHYLSSMRHHGHIVPKDHPDAGSRALPCGYPGQTGGSHRGEVANPRDLPCGYTGQTGGSQK